MRKCVLFLLFLFKNLNFHFVLHHVQSADIYVLCVDMCDFLIQGSRIEAFTVLRILMEQYQKFPVEGEVYHIENFNVISNLDQYRFAAHPWKLKFHPSTIIRKSTAHINAHEYNFVSIKEISTHSANNIELIGMLLSSIILLFPISAIMYLRLYSVY